MKHAIEYLEKTTAQLEANLALARRRRGEILDSPGNALYRADLQKEIDDLVPQVRDFKIAIAALKDLHDFKPQG